MKSKRQVDTKREKIVTEALIGMLKDNISDIDIKTNYDKKGSVAKFENQT